MAALFHALLTKAKKATLCWLPEQFGRPFKAARNLQKLSALNLTAQAKPAIGVPFLCLEELKVVPRTRIKIVVHICFLNFCPI